MNNLLRLHHFSIPSTVKVGLRYGIAVAAGTFLFKAITIALLHFPSLTEPLLSLVILITLAGTYLYFRFQRPEKSKLNRLSKREKELLPLLLSNKTNKAICEELFIAQSTLKSHINRINKKLGVKNRQELTALYASKIG
jgi:DNA-binding CsgD family transcriptional regulator